MKTLMYILSNDAKWMEREDDLPFTPHAGLAIEGLTDEQPIKINTMTYNVTEQHFKLRMSWVSPDPMTSKDMLKLNLGWRLKP